MKIALAGVAGSGKDYLADCLINEYNFQRVAFADTLKETVQEIFPWMQKDYPANIKEQPLNIEINGSLVTKTPREMWLETSKFIRSVDPLYFHKKTMVKIGQMDGNIVITDLRMMVEFQDLRMMGFHTVEIVKPDNPYIPNDFDKQIDEFRFMIQNTFVNDQVGTDKFKQFLKDSYGI